MEHATGLSGFVVELLVSFANFDALGSRIVYGYSLSQGFLNRAYWMHRDSLQPSRFFQTLQLCIEDFYSVVTPREVIPETANLYGPRPRQAVHGIALLWCN